MPNYKRTSDGVPDGGQRLFLVSPRVPQGPPDSAAAPARAPPSSGTTQAPARVLLGAGDELGPQALPEQAIVPQATHILAVRGPVRFGHVVTIMRPTCPRTPALVLTGRKGEGRDRPRHAEPGAQDSLLATRFAATYRAVFVSASR